MRPDTITIAVEEKYTPEEKAEIAGHMAAAVAEAETITGEKKLSDAAFNERIKKAEAQVTQLARQYNKGTEIAQIGCDIRYDMPEPGKKSYVRMDNGETAEVHDMSWEERQDTLQFPLTATAIDAAPVYRCPKCKNAAIVAIDDRWKCGCGFETYVPNFRQASTER